MTNVIADMDKHTPALFILSVGADPTDAIETFARKTGQSVRSAALLCLFLLGAVLTTVCGVHCSSSACLLATDSHLWRRAP
jgi:hypothetical protein